MQIKLQKNYQKKEAPTCQKLYQNFGEDILLPNDELNRSKLANIIYNNEEKRKMLNNSTLKYIREEIVNRIQKMDDDLIVIDAPLLFEAELEKICNITIAIVLENRKAQIARIMQRDTINEEQTIARLNAQYDNEFYISHCKYTIFNDGKMEDLEEQIQNIMENI